MLISMRKADGFAQVLSIPYELIHLLLYKYGAGAHLWNISVGRYSSWAKVGRHIKSILHPSMLITSDNIWTRVVQYTIDICHQTFHLTSVSTNFRTKTLRNRLLVHPVGDLDQSAILYRLRFSYCVSLHTNSQGVAAVGFGPLYRRSFADYCRFNDQRGLGRPNVVHPFVLHIEAPNANFTESWSGNSLCSRYIVSCFSIDQTFFRPPLLNFDSICITSILRTIASFRLAREADVTYEMVSVSLWSSVTSFPQPYSSLLLIFFFFQ